MSPAILVLISTLFLKIVSPLVDAKDHQSFDSRWAQWQSKVPDWNYWPKAPFQSPAEEKKWLISVLSDKTVVSVQERHQTVMILSQLYFLRPQGREHVHTHVASTLDPYAQELRTLFRHLGFIDAKMPPHGEHFEAVLVNGAFESVMLQRINFLRHLWDTQGIRFKTVILLSGDRDILETEPHYRQLSKRPLYETDVMEALWHEAVAAHPMRDVNVQLVRAPKIVLDNGTKSRPTTETTLRTWLLKKPSQGRYLFVSSNPYILYQEQVALTILPPSYTLEPVGPAASEHEAPKEILDAIARYVYQSFQRTGKH